jgi:hypothetical protein
VAGDAPAIVRSQILEELVAEIGLGSAAEDAREKRADGRLGWVSHRSS